jgi:hypothetical protein
MVETADSIPNTARVQGDDSLSNSTAGGQAKRVILRLRVDDFSGKDSLEYNDAIKSYLAFAGREPAEWEKRIHFAHIEPFQDSELRQTRFHITLDIEQDLVETPDFEKLLHEVYRVRRDGKRELYGIRNPLPGID